MDEKVNFWYWYCPDSKAACASPLMIRVNFITINDFTCFPYTDSTDKIYSPALTWHSRDTGRLLLAERTLSLFSGIILFFYFFQTFYINLRFHWKDSMHKKWILIYSFFKNEPNISFRCMFKTHCWRLFHYEKLFEMTERWNLLNLFKRKLNQDC